MRTHSNCVFMSKMATERLTLRAYTMKNPKKAITAKKCRLPIGEGEGVVVWDLVRKWLIDLDRVCACSLAW
jgi:hypothetical protein